MCNNYYLCYGDVPAWIIMLCAFFVILLILLWVIYFVDNLKVAKLSFDAVIDEYVVVRISFSENNGFKIFSGGRMTREEACKLKQAILSKKTTIFVGSQLQSAIILLFGSVYVSSYGRFERVGIDRNELLNQLNKAISLVEPDGHPKKYPTL